MEARECRKKRQTGAPHACSRRSPPPRGCGCAPSKVPSAGPKRLAQDPSSSPGLWSSAPASTEHTSRKRHPRALQRKTLACARPTPGATPPRVARTRLDPHPHGAAHHLRPEPSPGMSVPVMAGGCFGCHQDRTAAWKSRFRACPTGASATSALRIRRDARPRRIRRLACPHAPAHRIRAFAWRRNAPKRRPQQRCASQHPHEHTSSDLDFSRARARTSARSAQRRGTTR